MEFYINKEHQDLLIVEGDRCALHFLRIAGSVVNRARMWGLDAVDSCREVLDNNRDVATGDATYRDLINNGFYTKVDAAYFN